MGQKQISSKFQCIFEWHLMFIDTYPVSKGEILKKHCPTRAKFNMTVPERAIFTFHILNITAFMKETFKKYTDKCNR